MLSNDRVGRFTSSEIWKLMTKDRSGQGFGKPALQYIRDKRVEFDLGRSIDIESFSSATAWGRLLEKRAFEQLGLEYSLVSQDTIVDKSGIWAGTPDAIKHGKTKTVCDLKCPYTLRSFAELAEPLRAGLENLEAINALRKGHKAGEAYYWQLIANSILTESQWAELIIYMPYEKEIEDIKELALEEDSLDSRYYWIYNAPTHELPWIPNDCDYKNLYTYRFKVPAEDKKALKQKIKLANEYGRE